LRRLPRSLLLCLLSLRLLLLGLLCLSLLLSRLLFGLLLLRGCLLLRAQVSRLRGIDDGLLLLRDGRRLHLVALLAVARRLGEQSRHGRRRHQTGNDDGACRHGNEGMKAAR
jgi:hypothetical protein